MKIHFTASSSPLAKQAFADLTRRYGQAVAAKADVVVALGGDGHTLHTLHEMMKSDTPVFAMHRASADSTGFLCNAYHQGNLAKRIGKARSVTLHPLRLEVTTAKKTIHKAWAINEVAVVRETPQSVKLRILVDGVQRFDGEVFSGDGIMVATPAGSTAYNRSCGGPIMPVDANMLAMTAISGFRPRGWKHALLPQDAVVEIDALETAKRPVRIEADSVAVGDAKKVRLWLDRNQSLTLLFDPDQHLSERIIREQFRP